MDRLIALAGRLGKAIRDTERFSRLRQAEEALEADEEARKALSEAEALQRQIAEREAEGKPVEPEEKHRLADLQSAVHASQTLQGLARAQADYMELMNEVNGAIRNELGVGEDGAI